VTHQLVAQHGDIAQTLDFGVDHFIALIFTGLVHHTECAGGVEHGLFAILQSFISDLFTLLIVFWSLSR